MYNRLNIRVAVRLNQPQKKRLDLYCERKGITVSELLRGFVKDLDEGVPSSPKDTRPCTTQKQVIS